MTALQFRQITASASCEVRLRTSAPYASDLRSCLGEALHGTPEYERLFEPPMPDREPPRRLRGSSHPPGPLLLRGPEPWRLPPQGGRVRFRITTFRVGDGDCRVLSMALHWAGDRGLGGPRVPFRVDQVCLGASREVEEAARDRWKELAGGNDEADVEIVFRSPAYMLRRKLPVRPSPASLVEAILQRWEHLSWAYADSAGVPDAGAFDLACDAEDAGFEDRLRWWEGSRKSARQKQRVPMQGYLGTLRCRVTEPVGVVLCAGEILGVGKGTVLGLGQLRLSASARSRD